MRIHMARTTSSPQELRQAFRSNVSPIREGDCTVRFRVSDTRCGTYVICPAYLQSGALPAELHAHSRSHSDSKAFTAVPKSIPSHFRCHCTRTVPKPPSPGTSCAWPTVISLAKYVKTKVVRLAYRDCLGCSWIVQPLPNRVTSDLPVICSELEIRDKLSDPSHSASTFKSHHYVELLDQRRTRRARSVFQRLAPPTSVSISNGICSG